MIFFLFVLFRLFFSFGIDVTSKIFIIRQAICLVLIYVFNKHNKIDKKSKQKYMYIYYCEMCFVPVFHLNHHNGSCKIANV